MRTFLVTVEAFGHVSIDRVRASTKANAVDKRLEQLGVVIKAEEVATTAADRAKP